MGVEASGEEQELAPSLLRKIVHQWLCMKKTLSRAT